MFHYCVVRVLNLTVECSRRTASRSAAMALLSERLVCTVVVWMTGQVGWLRRTPPAFHATATKRVGEGTN